MQPAPTPLTFRPLAPADRNAALAVINDAARWYAEFLAPDQRHEPEMTATQYDAEGARMTWYGAFDNGRLVAVMGLEHISDVALVRHGYVLPDWQRQGVGGSLLEHLECEAGNVARIIIGTYAANHKARARLEKSGYRLSPDSRSVLRTYFAIPEDRLVSSVTYEKVVSR